MRNQDSASDAELLEGIGAGDGDAFSAFYRRYLAPVTAFLLARTNDREAAADLAAEVFAAVLISADRYREKSGTAAPWLLSIAHHKLVSSLRRQVVESRARQKLGYEPVSLEDADLVRVEEIAIAGHERLDELILGLSESQRAALQLVVIDEQPYAQAAARLQTSEMVVRKRVSRALQTLRTQLPENP